MEQHGITLRGIPYELGSGDDSGKPCIDGGFFYLGYYMVFIIASNVTVIGFYFYNEGFGSPIDILGAGGILSENFFNSTAVICINVFNSSAKIFNNTIIHSRVAIDSSVSSYHNIYRNVIHDCEIGIAYNASSNIIISDNIIYNCEVGIWLQDGSDNVVKRNRSYNCRQYGIKCGGINTTIAYNILERNLVGLGADGPVTIEKNNFLNNTIYATFFIDINSVGSLQFNENYWGGQHVLPKYIFGLAYRRQTQFPYKIRAIFPFMKIDKHPAQEPYDIL